MSNTAESSAESKYRKVSSPYGFSMYDVEATAAIEKASRAAQEIVKAHGFERIMPAMVDYPETFSESQHSEMFSLKDNSGERLALRNDITAQVIKGYVRQIKRKSGVNLRKFYYAAPVYKDVRKNYPLPREIWQIGCEIVGENADSHLAELLTISQRIMREVFGHETATQIADVRLRNIFAELAGPDYPAAERRRDAPFLVRILTDEFSVTEAEARELALWFFYPTPEKKIPQAVASLPDILQAAIGEAAAEAERRSGCWQLPALRQSGSRCVNRAVATIAACSLKHMRAVSLNRWCAGEFTTNSSAATPRLKPAHAALPSISCSFLRHEKSHKVRLFRSIAKNLCESQSRTGARQG